MGDDFIKSFLSFKIATKTEGLPNQAGIHPSAPPPRVILQAPVPSHGLMANKEALTPPLSAPVLRPHKKLNNG